MRILSMTATFGKLNNETIHFDPKLQVIEAPNEWGKSTWCAFITAMLYGIDSRQRSTDAALADKERFKPWSGAPMSGRMEIAHQGRRITIERQSKGRLQMNVFRAFDTDTGLDIPGLTADNCGQMLLGVEKEVFLRSAFIKQSDLPVSDNQALHARLNALVTTGDDSGAAEALAEKLSALKNKCRHNKTGLLPEAERQREELRLKLRQQRELQHQQIHLSEQLESLAEYERQLQNHQAALRYEASLTHTQKLAAAQNAKELAQARLDALQAECKALPSELELEQKLSALRQLRSQRDDVQMLSQMLPGAPQKPAEEAFSVEAAKADYEAYTALNKKAAPLPYILAAVLFVIGAGLLLLPMPWLFAAAIPVLAGFALIFSAISKKRKQKGTLQKLLAKYPGILPENWIANAQNKANIRLRYEADLRSYEQQTQSIRQQMQALKERTDGLTGGMSLADFEHQLLQARQRRNALTDAHRELQSADALLAALNANHQAVAPPTEPDTLTYTAQETARLLSDAAVNRSQLQQRLGQCQGQMASLEQEELLSVQFDKVSDRINQLEQVYSAVVMAQEYLGKATLELQQRFAPRISQRAQATMARLTDGRYDRLYLKSNLTLDTGTRGEVPLHAPLWRSEGTIDQLYFALRLAIADELTADAPLILDDAFVRFDDVRLQKALLLLKEESENKQVLIFTCQGRENRLLSAQ